MPRLDWYAFHVSDYRADTWHLNRAQDYAYRQILDEIFASGQHEQPPSIPDDDRFLMKLCKADSAEEWAETRLVLIDGQRALLRSEHGRLSQKRMTAEVMQAIARSEHGKKAANGRWGKNGPRIAQDASEQKPRGVGLGGSESRGDGAGTQQIDTIQRVFQVLAPAAPVPDDFTVSRWLRDLSPDPWVVAAAAVEIAQKLNGNRSTAYINKAMLNKFAEGYAPDDPEGFVRYSTDPKRIAKMTEVNSGLRVK